MKKTGIITLYSNFNYGNRLQNLAVQTILSEYGFNADTIICINSFRKWHIYIFKQYIKGIFLGDPIAARACRFLNFNKKHIRIKYLYGDKKLALSKLVSKYDYFITGSDQVWNVKLNKKVEEDYYFYFLLFAEDAQKICISPSIGLSTIPEEYVERMCKRLSGFSFLSCREKQGAQEISRITGRECKWLIDPTLFVSREKWENILSLRSLNRTPYIFLFFLDGMSKELGRHIKEYAGAGGYKIIDPSDPHSGFFSIDPSEFVAFLSGAHMVFTDSFHVTAFSINFHIPFYVFSRNLYQNMTSRIESICESFCLEHRYIRQQKEFEIQEFCSFEDADKQLIIERKKFSNYLDECFGKKLKGKF